MSDNSIIEARLSLLEHKLSEVQAKLQKSESTQPFKVEAGKIFIEEAPIKNAAICTVVSAGSMHIASSVLDELKDKHSAQLKIAESQYSAIRGVDWDLSSLRMSIAKAEAVTDQTLNTVRLHLSTSQRNSLSQFLADCRCLKSFLDTCALLPADIQDSSLPGEQKSGHGL
ncbi:hypothetical protein BK025_06030 [Sodalis sp. TME1]|nr:hypothetical protein BK025_06030 [Sodalis sp. TME1]